MDAEWLKTQFQLHPERTRADLARALALDPPAVSKILAGGRQIKAHEYIIMRQFFGLPVDGQKAAASEGYHLRTLTRQGLADHDRPADQDAWVMPARLLESKTQAPPEKIRIYTVQDNSMAPDFAIGSQVLVDLSDLVPSPPGVFILSDGLGYVLRQCDVVPGEKPLQFNISSRSGASFRLLADKSGIIGRVIARLEWLK